DGEEPPPAAPPETEADPVSGPVSGTVLVVEDDALFRGLMAEVLEAEGYRVLTASEPAEARGLCSGRLEAVDLLVSDLVMPGGNGVELASELRGRYPDLRVILMSGYSGDELASRDLDEVQAEGFLEKPFDVSSLLRMVRSVLS
ncbi:MAG TPA: response regulator, partial [Thermoanaerobaculia bacterium]